jgi:hypothetical protein
VIVKVYYVFYVIVTHNDTRSVKCKPRNVQEIVLRRVVSGKGQEITGCWRGVYNGELLYMLSLVKQIFVKFFFKFM